MTRLAVLGGAVLATILVVAARFVFFVPEYGDARAYLGYFEGLVPLASYQPAYPWLLYALGRTTDDPDVIRRVQTALYAASALLFLATGRAIGAPLAGAAAALALALGLRHYFYVALPLTEVTSLFAFAVALLAIVASVRPRRGVRRLAADGAVAASLVALTFVRTSNALFLVLLALFAGVAGLAGARPALRRVALVALPCAVAAALYQVAVQERGGGNLGMSLSNFVGSACAGAHGRCPRSVFANDDTPRLRRQLRRNGAIGNPADAFPDPFAPAVAHELRLAYVRLLRDAPGVAVRRMLATWLEQVRAAGPPSAYAEDVNLALLRERWAAPLHAAGAFAGAVLAVSAPFVVLLAPLAVRRRAPDARAVAACALGAWTAGELIASIALFANTYPLDAGRMRLHYEVQVLMLWCLLLGEVRRRTPAAAAGGGAPLGPG